MSLLRRLFYKKADDEDYEAVLAGLAASIQTRQTRLSELRLRERRASLLVTLYALAAWAAYVGLWYVNVLPTAHGRQKVAKGLPVVVGPVVILFTRRIVQIWYKRKGDAEEKTLRELLKQQRTKVEEIKKKTNFYSTKSLLDRYDEGSPAGSPARPRPPPQVQAPSQPVQQPSTPQRPPQVPAPGTQPRTPLPASLQNQLLSPQQYGTPPPPPRKQWYDKVADALLGDDEAPPSSRFALICEQCAAHNGLVKESLWEETQYVCPKCGHFNPAPRTKSARAQASQPPSPASSLGSSPAARQPTPPSPDSPALRKRVRRQADDADASMMELDS